MNDRDFSICFFCTEFLICLLLYSYALENIHCDSCTEDEEVFVQLNWAACAFSFYGPLIGLISFLLSFLVINEYTVRPIKNEVK